MPFCQEFRRRARQTHFWKELGIALGIVFSFALVGVLILIFLNNASSIRKIDPHPLLGGPAGKAKAMLQRTTERPDSGGNQPVANSTSPIEHAKRDASLNYCMLLKTWNNMGAIRVDEHDVCCALYVKQACNETIAPDEPGLKPGICVLLSSEVFTRLCVIKEKLPPEAGQLV